MSSRAVAAMVLACATGGCAHSSTELARSGDVLKMKKQLAAALLGHREWAGATAPLRELAAREPRDVDVHVMLATAYREQSLYDDAEREYKAALAIESRRADAWDGMGVMRDLRGDSGDAALGDLKKAIALQPDSAPHYNNLGFALFRRARYTEAVEAYRHGLSKDPTMSRMRNNLGFTYGRLGQLNYAKREFARAGAKAEAENNLGWVYEQAGDVASACDRYREAAQLAPTLEVARVNLSRACGAAAAKDPQSSDGVSGAGLGAAAGPLQAAATPKGPAAADPNPKKSRRRIP